MNRQIFKFRITGILIVLVMFAVFAVAVMCLWNALMPDIFTLPAVNYWQALGLLLLARIIFGGLSGGLNHRRHHGGGQIFQHGNKLREKWMNMSGEERKEFMEKEKDFFKFHKDFSRFDHFFGGGEGGKDDKNE